MPAPPIAPAAQPAVVLPPARDTEIRAASVRIVPGAFLLSGNTVFPDEMLLPLLGSFVNQPTDIAGLTRAAGTISAFYRARGYLLTEAYLPEQQFASSGGVVLINVIEAKIGKVSVDVSGAGLSAPFAQSVAHGNLRSGDFVTGYSLDKPVLLLRDLAGYDASATVEPGARLGEADVRVTVSPKGPRYEASASIDNHGATAAGALRAGVNLNTSNLTGRGDVLAIGAQVNDQKNSNLFRASYTMPVGNGNTRVGVSAARLNYTLGGQFAALGASGKAEIVGASISQALLRGRDANIYGVAVAEQKKLVDETATPVLKSERELSSFRVGLSGNFVDGLGSGTAFNSYAVNQTFGRLTLSAADLAFDSAFGGLQTAGSFSRFNLDYQRIQFLGTSSSVYFTAQAQLASKNLSSAEKMALGGPNGVRAYPIGEGIGDAGSLVSIEYRYQLSPSWLPVTEPVSLVAFYDYGRIQFNQNGAVVPGTSNGLVLGGVGIGAMLGRAGHTVIKTHLAWRTTDALPSTGDADRSPRAWLSAQTWF